MARPAPSPLVGLLALALLGCGDDDDPAAAPAPEPAAPPAPIAGTRAIATPAGFDLVAVEGGAALVWGPPASDGGGVHLVLLDPLGGVRGDTRVLYDSQPTEVAPVPPDAVEISAASGGGRLLVSFVARLQPELHVMATHGPEAAAAFAPVEDLGKVEVESVGHRGLLASAAGPDGRVATLYRERRGPCPSGEAAGGQAESSSGCVHFGVRRIGGSPGGSSRRGLPLAAPSPCEHAVAGYLWSAGVWYYGLCTAPDGTQSTTVYAIQFDPEYAHADQALEGCEPLGMVPSDDGVVLVGRCDGDAVGAVAFADAAQRRLELPRARRAVECREGRPTLSMTAGERRVQLSLGGPHSRLGPWLPEDVAPPGAQAVWTGDALLVAHPVARDVSLRRYECMDGELVRTDTP